MDQPSESDETVALRAERGNQVLTWDTHPVMAASLKDHLESAGWTVTISHDGPHRRRLRPRIETRLAFRPSGR